MGAFARAIYALERDELTGKRFRNHWIAKRSYTGILYHRNSVKLSGNPRTSFVAWNIETIFARFTGSFSRGKA
jgi:hypothetical protein